MEEELKVFWAILPRNPSKNELSHVFINSEHIVSTDTKIMVRKKHDLDVDKKMLVINNKAKVPIAAEGIFNGQPVNYGWSSGYPDTTRIYNKFSTQGRLQRAEGQDFITALYITAESGHIIDFIAYGPALKKIAKALGDEEVAEVRVGEDTPIYMAIGGYEFLFMPIVFPRK